MWFYYNKLYHKEGRICGGGCRVDQGAIPGESTGLLPFDGEELKMMAADYPDDESWQEWQKTTKQEMDQILSTSSYCISPQIHYMTPSFGRCFMIEYKQI